VAQEDDAERAVRAALDLVSGVRRLAAGLEARAGILTGEAAVNLGARGQGMVAGDLVNTASRLQSVAAPGSVLVDEATRRAAEAAVVFEDAGDQILKGKSVPLAASRAVRVVAERGGRRRSGTLEAPFVGRDDDLRMLQDLYHATARERRARLVSITGQAGIGKSRLVWELEKYFDGLVETLYWHHGRSPTYGEGITFWALGEMVRRRAGLAEGDDEATTRAGISDTVTQWVPDEADRRWIEASLLALLGVGEVPSEGRDELFAAWRAFFEAIARQAPTVLVFEDLHAADSGLLDFIDHLLDWSRDYPILVITMARPELLERRPSWGAGRRNFVGMALEPLPDASMRELLAGLVPGLPETVVRAILSRADGVPLYAVETVRMLVNEGRLERVGDAYQPIGDLGGMAVPESLHALIAARLDAIEPADRQLLQDGAVLGQNFTVAALAALTGEPAGTVEARLRALVRRELMRFEDDPRSPERGQYGFTQGLVREVAYGTLARRQRRDRHLAAARYYEALGDEELAGILAAHYLSAYEQSPENDERAALGIQARLALNGAAERATSLGANEQALRYLEDALTIALDPQEEATVRESAGVAATAAGRVDDAARHLDRAVELYEQRGDGAAAIRAATTQANVFISVFRLAEAAALLDSVVARHPELVDSPEAVAVSAALARCAFMTGDYARAISLSDQALDAAEHANQIDLIADALITRANSLVAFGRGRESRIVHEGVIRFAELNGLTRAGMRAMISLCATQATTEPRDGMALARRGLPQARRLGWRTVQRFFVANGAEAALRLGEWDWTITEIGLLLPELSDPGDRADTVAELASVQTLRGQATAELMAELLATAPDDPQGRAEVKCVLSRVALAEGRLDDAFAAAMDGADLTTEYGFAAIPLAAHAAIWSRDRTRALAVVEVTRGWYSPALEADVATIRAGLEALAGNEHAALAGYHGAQASWRELGCDFDLALSAIDMATLLGRGHPEVVAAADEARVILERIGARPLLDRLEAAFPVTSSVTIAPWADAQRRNRALASGVEDGPAVVPDGHAPGPGGSRSS
jgi:tetratricopeptide (TPR) repeat protein